MHGYGVKIWALEKIKRINHVSKKRQEKKTKCFYFVWWWCRGSWNFQECFLLTYELMLSTIRSSRFSLVFVVALSLVTVLLHGGVCDGGDSKWY